MYLGEPRTRPVTVSTLRKMKASGEKIAMLTAYDASFAAMLDAADVDVILVGDSLGMVIQGHDTTVPVTMDDIVYHSRAVSRGLHRPFLMADLPFMSYPSKERALENSVRLMQEGGAEMVKLESGAGQVEIVEFLASHDIAVCAHLGLRPQSVHKTGGFRVQGREQAATGADHHRPAGRAVAPRHGLVHGERRGQRQLQSAEAARNPQPEQAEAEQFGRDRAGQARGAPAGGHFRAQQRVEHGDGGEQAGCCLSPGGDTCSRHCVAHSGP